MAEAPSCNPPEARPGAQGQGTEPHGMTRADLVALGPRPPAVPPPQHLRKGPHAPGAAAGSGGPAPSRARSLCRLRSRGGRPGTVRRSDRAAGGPRPPARPPPRHLLAEGHGRRSASGSPPRRRPAAGRRRAGRSPSIPRSRSIHRPRAGSARDKPRAGAAEPARAPRRRETEAVPASRRSVTPPRVPVLSGVQCWAPPHPSAER